MYWRKFVRNVSARSLSFSFDRNAESFRTLSATSSDCAFPRMNSVEVFQPYRLRRISDCRDQKHECNQRQTVQFYRFSSCTGKHPEFLANCPDLPPVLAVPISTRRGPPVPYEGYPFEGEPVQAELSAGMKLSAKTQDSTSTE